MLRQFSIRQSLLLGLILLLFSTSGAILVSTVLGAIRASEALTREVIDEAGVLVTQEVDAYFAEVERSLRIVAAWAQTNDLGPADTDAWLPLLQPLIAQNPRVSSVLVGTSTGTELMLLQDPLDAAQWTARSVDPQRWASAASFRRWRAGVDDVGEEALESIAYDPRTRLYYRTALAADSIRTVAWTPPTVFFTTRDPGMTASTFWVGAAGDTTVLAFDVLLLDLSRLTTAQDISEHGIAFVLSDDTPARVLGLPREAEALDASGIRTRLIPGGGPADADARPALHVAGQSGIPVLDAASQAWHANGRPDDSLRFTFEDKTWWANFTRTSVGSNAFVIAAAAPESDFIAGLASSARRIIIVSLFALVLATILATRLASGYARPLEALAQASRRLQKLDLSPAQDVPTRVREIQELVREQERTRIALSSFSRYIPVEIVRNLVAQGVAAKLGGERRVITILFTDIEGFTSIAERYSAEEVTALLTDYFEVLIDTIRAHGGEVNELLGDGIVAYWGAPTRREDHAARAVGAILACQERVAELSARSGGERPPLPTCCGVDSGQVVIGNIGSASRLAYKAVGDTANLASRIEGLNRIYGTRMLVSGATRELAGDDFEWREIDAVRVKGRSATTHLFEPLGRRGEVAAERLAFRDRYEAALRHYRQAAFEDALRALEDALQLHPEDRPASRLLALVREQLQQDDRPAGWSEAWDGVSTFLTK